MAYDPEALTLEQKRPAVTVRPLGRVAQADTGQSMSDIFGPVPDTAPAEKSLEDIFGPVAKQGQNVENYNPRPSGENGIVYPPTVKPGDIFKPEKDVDYDTGAPEGVRFNLARAQNENEAKRLLTNAYGAGNFRQDPGGRWIVKDPTGKERSVFPEGSFRAMAQKGMTYAGAATPVGIGTAAGTILGAPAGPPGMAIGAGFGGAAGHLADQGVKALQGFYDQSMPELAGHTALEGGMNAAFQGAPWLKHALRNSFYNTTTDLFSRAGGVTPERQALTRSLEPYGVTPPIQSIAPRLKALEYDRLQRNRISGDPMAADRRAVVDERIGEVLDGTGMAPADRANAMVYINDTTSGRVGGVSGQAVRDAMTARDANSQLYQDAFVEDARRALDRAYSTYTRNISQPAYTTSRQDAVTASGNLARGLRTTMEDAREEFGREFNDVYDNIHKAAGEKPVLDMSEAVTLAQEYLNPVPAPLRRLTSLAGEREMPPENVAPDATMDEIKAVMDWIASKGTGGSPAMAGAPAAGGPQLVNNELVTIKEGHMLRNNLIEMARLSSDVYQGGVRRGEIMQIVGAIDRAMDQVGLEAGGTVGMLMRDANARYAEGVQRFTKDDINKILRQTRDGRPPDAGVVADAIMDRKSLTATKQIYDMLSPEMKFAVQQADLQNIISASTIPVGRFGRPTLDPDALLDALAERASLHRFMYGRADPLLNELRELAVNFKALGGEVELDALPSRGNVAAFGRSPVGVSGAASDIRNSLRAAAAEQRARELEVRTDALASLRADDPKLVQQGARYILGSEARTVRAAELLGPTSPEWRTLQHEAVIEILRSAVVPLQGGVGNTINARALEGALGNLTNRQQRMLLNGPLYDDIRLLAQQAKMLFPELAQDPGGSLAAASTLGNLPKANAIRRMLWSRVAGAIADSPTLARVLAGSIRMDPYRGRRMLGYMMQTGANVGVAAAQGGGGGGPAGDNSFQERLRDLESVHQPVPKDQGYQGPAVQ